MLVDMSAADDFTIQRTTDLDLHVDELWTLVSTAAGWESWLVDGADITVAPDATGTATVDESERSVRIETVVSGRSVSFSWWDRDGGDGRTSVSHVHLDVVELPDGRSRLHVCEQLQPAPTASASATASLATGIRWDVALVSLWMLALHSLVMA